MFLIYHIKEKEDKMKEEKANQKRYSYAKNKRWVVERTNSMA